MTEIPAATHSRIDWVERAALIGSAACLIHCLALPIAFAALPVLSRVLRIPEAFHLWMIVAVVPLSTMALLAGRSRHRGRAPLAVGFAGLVALAIGALAFGGGAAETPVTVAGSLMLAWAHVANWRLRHAAGG